MFRFVTVICINNNRNRLSEKYLPLALCHKYPNSQKLYLRRKIQCSTPFVACIIYQSLHYRESGIHISATFFHDSCKLSYLKTPSCFAFGRIPHLAWFVHVKFTNRLDKTYPTFKSCFATEKLNSSSELSNS